MQRTKRLPLQSISREGIRLALAKPIASQHLSPRLIVALLTGEIELTAPL
jgi:hypothetical protein